MSSDEAKAAGLESPSGYFSAKNDKENNTPQSHLKDWCKMESVSLGNGPDGNLRDLRSDSVGVVARWQYPTNSSFTEDVTADQLQAIKNLLRLGEHRKDNQAIGWAGYVVGQILGIGTSKDTMKPHDKRRITRMLETWVSEGHLEEYTAKVDRQSKVFLRTF
jgi:hypothetical protein